MGWFSFWGPLHFWGDLHFWVVFILGLNLFSKVVFMFETLFVTFEVLIIFGFNFIYTIVHKATAPKNCVKIYKKPLDSLSYIIGRLPMLPIFLDMAHMIHTHTQKLGSMHISSNLKWTKIICKFWLFFNLPSPDIKTVLFGGFKKNKRKIQVESHSGGF